MKQKESIKKAPVEEHKKLLKIRWARNYINLYAESLKVFTASRGKGLRFHFNWLWLKAGNVYQAQEGLDLVVKKHVVTHLIKRHHLKYHRVQRNKKKSKEVFCEKLVKWHAALRERLVRTGAKEWSKKGVKRRHHSRKGWEGMDKSTHIWRW